MLRPPNPHLFTVNTIIGSGTKLQGELITNGVVRIDGEFKGTIYSPGKVIISATGLVHNDIAAGEIIVGGTVAGDIYASDSVSILLGAHIFGNIVTSHLDIENGAVFEGNCRIENDLTYEKIIKIAGLPEPKGHTPPVDDPRDTWSKNSQQQFSDITAQNSPDKN